MSPVSIFEAGVSLVSMSKVSIWTCEGGGWFSSTVGMTRSHLEWPCCVHFLAGAGGKIIAGVELRGRLARRLGSVRGSPLRFGLEAVVSSEACAIWV